MTGERARHLALVGLGVAFVAPVIVVLSAFAARVGLIPVETAVSLVTLGVARSVAFAAPAVILTVLWITRRDWRRAAKYAVPAFVVSALSLGLFQYHAVQLARSGPLDVSTNPGDSPVLRLQAGLPGTCEGLAAVETQILPESAAWALQEQGFAITKAGLFEVEGTRQGFWFGRRYDAVVRIRPGRTDLRLATEGDRADGGAVCRQALGLAKLLQPVV